MSTEGRIVSRSPVHVISQNDVWINTDPAAGEVYEIERRKINSRWVPVYALSKLALDKLLVAAGIKQKESVVEELRPNVWKAKFVGEWEQPDGTQIELEATKVIDLTIGGPRYTERYQKEVDNLLSKYAADRGINRRQDETRDQWFGRVRYHLHKQDPDILDEIDFIAAEVAKRTTQKAAQFGAELAETGAINRAIRTLLQIGTYTKEYLDNNPITVYRSQIDWEAARNLLGEEYTKSVIAGMVQQNLGVDSVEMLSLDAPEEEEPSIWEATIQKEQELSIKAYYADRDDKDPDEMTQALFGKNVSELTDGEARLTLLALDELEHDASSGGDRVEFFNHLRGVIRKCAGERRIPDKEELWQMNF